MASLRPHAQTQKYIQLAKQLPATLRRFLARYPHPAIQEPGAELTYYQKDHPNPFVPTIHPVTRRKHDPVYSMRRQADLAKAARKYGIEELLPWSKKKTEVRLAKKVEFGSRVKGTGVGQQVKGHKHERDLGKKYVGSLFGMAARPRPGEGFSWADLMLQDGNEERGYAQDARAHQGMEGGTSQLGSHLGALLCANCLCRWAGKTGRGGPTKGQHCMEGPGLFHVQTCTKYNIYSRTSHPTEFFVLASVDGQSRMGCSLLPTVTAKHSELRCIGSKGHRSTLLISSNLHGPSRIDLALFFCISMSRGSDTLMSTYRS